LIVSLLDLHPTVPDLNNLIEDRLEIFEAGTGQGALTLNLARAIHGANPTAPKIPDSDHGAILDEIEAQRKAYRDWRANRRAVIHTLDSSGRHSEHARTIVKNFRHGMYYPHVDFHIGSIDEYISSRLVETGNSPFLEHAILDLPETHHYFNIIGKALKPNGSLLTFCPNITQITAELKFARQNKLPLFLEKVVEVGVAVGVGGREWNVRPVKPRALLKAQENAEPPESLEETEEALKYAAEDLRVIAREASGYETPASDDNGWKIICRPKVGLRIFGGGFVGVWRKMADARV
jgi:tRNA (adenine57-N1/adenine58-N1)-methyltransferase